MNARETMAFKAMLKRIAAEENVSAQVVLQNYMFERLMARLVKLPLRKNLILKGGLLVSHLLGLSRRTTMDMDVTLRNAELSEATVRSWMERILSVDVGDGVGWTPRGIAPMRDDGICGGYRVKMTASFGGYDTSRQFELWYNLKGRLKMWRGTMKAIDPKAHELAKQALATVK